MQSRAPAALSRGGGQAGTSSGPRRGPCPRGHRQQTGQLPRGTSPIVQVVFDVTSPSPLRAKGRRQRAGRTQAAASEGPSPVARSRPRAPRGKTGRAPPHGSPRVVPAPRHGRSRRTCVHVRAHTHTCTLAPSPPPLAEPDLGRGAGPPPRASTVPAAGGGSLFVQAADAGPRQCGLRGALCQIP